MCVWLKGHKRCPAHDAQLLIVLPIKRSREGYKHWWLRLNSKFLDLIPDNMHSRPHFCFFFFFNKSKLKKKRKSTALLWNVRNNVALHIKVNETSQVCLDIHLPLKFILSTWPFLPTSAERFYMFAEYILQLCYTFVKNEPFWMSVQIPI